MRGSTNSKKRRGDIPSEGEDFLAWGTFHRWGQGDGQTHRGKREQGTNGGVALGKDKET